MSSSGNITFKRFGRSYHLCIDHAEDLRRVLDLDKAHWVATNAPIETLNCDPVFLGLVDTDNDGRIGCDDLVKAIRWLLDTLRDCGDVTVGSQTLKLDAINTNHQTGRGAHESAARILTRLGKADARCITLDQVNQIKTDIENTPISEMGVVLPEAATDAEVQEFMTDVVATVGGATHPSGRQGVDQAQLDKFVAGARAFLEWQLSGNISKNRSETEIMPLGAQTPEAFALLASVRDKIDQHFAQCEAVAFDPRVAQHIGPCDAEIANLDLTTPAAIEEFRRNAPLAKPTPLRVLSFDDQVNPYYAPQLTDFLTGFLKPLLGQSTSSLSQEQWQEVKERFTAYEAWMNAKPEAKFELLDSEKLRKYLDNKFGDAVRLLIEKCRATAIELDRIRGVEKLILYQMWILDLANNFVSFPHLYDAGRRALFEMGTLVMDGRRFNFSVKVNDRAEHMRIAKTSSMYVLYVQVASAPDKPKYEVAVPVTAGGKGNLCVGKRGVFYDIAGQECDATVVEIIENPISISEALVSPFQRLGRLLTGKIEAITSAGEKKLDTSVSTAVAAAQSSPQKPGGTATAAPSGQAIGGILMGGGVAIAALGSAWAFIANQLSNLHWYHVVVGVVCAMLAVILPTSILAFLKLRRRELSAILEGSGWAINARMRLTRRQGRFFTQRPTYPRHAKGVRRVRWWFIALVVLGAAGLGLQQYFLQRSDRAPQTPTKSPTTQVAPDTSSDQP